MRTVWPKSDVAVAPIVSQTAKKFKMNLNKLNKKTKNFIKLECALYRFVKQNKNGKF